MLQADRNGSNSLHIGFDRNLAHPDLVRRPEINILVNAFLLVMRASAVSRRTRKRDHNSTVCFIALPRHNQMSEMGKGNLKPKHLDALSGFRRFSVWSTCIL